MPPFLVPVTSLLLWGTCAIFFATQVHEISGLSAQFLGMIYFASFLILVYAWPMSGPTIAAVLSFGACFLSLYFFLSEKDPGFLLQIVLYACLYTMMAYFLYKVQQKIKHRNILMDRSLEGINLLQEQCQRLTAKCVALDRKIDSFKELQNFSQKIQGVLNQEQIGQSLIDQLRQHIPQTKYAYLWVGAMPNSRLVATDYAGNLISMSPLDKWVAQKSQAILVEDIHNDYRVGAQDYDYHNCLSHGVIPILAQNQQIGVLGLACVDAGALDSDDLRIAQMFVAAASSALSNSMLYKKMEELASRDGLTGLFVRRLLRQSLDNCIDSYRHNKEPFALVMIDIDFFKHYNDEYGHLAGDIVLKSFAGIIESHLQEGDFACRYGGEEFAMILVRCSSFEARQRIEKLRRAIEMYPFTLRREQHRVSASFGVAIYGRDGLSRYDLIKKADAFLYQAKHEGRNRVCGNFS